MESASFRLPDPRPSRMYLLTSPVLVFFFFFSSLVSIATMHYLAVALPLLTLALAAPSNSVPLTPLNSRQYSEDLAERQSWLLDQAKGLRSKYAPHLGERGQELRRRDIIDEGITRRKRANQKRATGTVS